ncbi:MAG: hypothetical protein ACRDYC_14310 [Acidimicrobiales bacterium]
MSDPTDEENLSGETEQESRAPWWRRPAAAVAAVVLLAGLGVGLGLGLSGGGKVIGPEGVPIQQVPDLTPNSTTATGQTIDGITCRTPANQSVKYHIHVLVEIFVNGQQRRLPAGAGIASPRFAEHLSTGLFYDDTESSCLYWLHIHADDGVIHVESPYVGTFTLGQFFDIWQQPLGPDQVGPAHGTVVSYINGKKFTGSPRDLPLLRHAVIQLDVGSPVVAFHNVRFAVNGLCGAGTQGCTLPGGAPAP